MSVQESMVSPAVAASGKAAVESVCEQVRELLQSRDLTCDELGLLYCYKHGVSLNQALKAAGFDGKVGDFVRGEAKHFVVEGSRVALIRESGAAGVEGVEQQLSSVLAARGGRMELAALCAAFAEQFGVSVASVAGCRPAELVQRHPELFVVKGSLVSARGAESESTVSESEGTVQSRSSLRLAERPSRAAGASLDEAAYRELHDRVSSRAFNSRVAQVVQATAEAVQARLFMRVKEVVKGGSVGHATAVSGRALPDAELVYVVEGLPKLRHDKWMPPLLRSVCSALQASLPASVATGVCLTDDSVRMVACGQVRVDVRFAPCYESVADVVESMAASEPRARRYFGPALTAARTQLVSRQPGWVKMGMRLVKWWRDEQRWSSGRCKPSDELLEAVCLYAASATTVSSAQGAGQHSAAQLVANVMALLARCDKLRIVFDTVYGREDIWGPLLMQRPLVMDPANPYVNLCDSKAFDSRELRSLAGTTRFFH